MAIVIKKRVNLDFLGEEYKDAYLVFRSIPAIELEQLMPKLEGLENNSQGSLTIVINILKDYFLTGEFPEDGKLQPVIKEDLDGLDPQSVLQCFKMFTGQELDPKDEKPLTSTSATAASPQPSS